MSECTNAMNQILKSETCVGTWRLQSDSQCGATDTKLANQYIVESLEISGAPINVFKLLGVHEQGKLIDLTGQGFPLSGGTSGDSSVSNAFDTGIDAWRSSQVGNEVAGNSFIGYDFGTKKTSFGAEKYKPKAPILNRISSIKITQSDIGARRATQVRIDRADKIVASNIISPTSGSIDITPGADAVECKIMVLAISATQFQVISSIHGVLGIATVGVPFNSMIVHLIIAPGAYLINDTFSFDLSLHWLRVDIINIPDNGSSNLVSFLNSVPSRYWRVVPLFFNGSASNEPWEVSKLELLDYEATSIDNIQDVFFLENRDRDYSQSSIMLRCQYQPFDPIGDLGKFGFSILDQWAFTVSFSAMVEKLGRPLIIGDILEVCPEISYDQNMKLVKKYLEVTDTGWAAEGYSPGWTPLLFRFTGQQLVPGQEHRDIIATADKLKYGVDDSEFFKGIQQITTSNLTVSENINAEARNQVPERGSDPQEIASGTSLYQPATSPGDRKGSYDGRDLYIEDGLPPDGKPYGEGFALPDMDTAQDGEYFRLNYPPDLNVPSRLYQFSIFKRKWIYIETDRRGEYSSHKPSAQKILSSSTAKSIKSL